MFNHSSTRQNIGWERSIAAGIITYTSLRDIPKGEELCISYGERLTFVDVEREILVGAYEGDGEELLGRIGLGLD